MGYKSTFKKYKIKKVNYLRHYFPSILHQLIEVGSGGYYFWGSPDGRRASLERILKAKVEKRFWKDPRFVVKNRYERVNSHVNMKPRWDR